MIHTVPKKSGNFFGPVAIMVKDWIFSELLLLQIGRLPGEIKNAISCLTEP
jgi:hypothetical protein